MPFDPAQVIPSEVEGCRPEGRVKKSLTRGPAFSRIGRNPPPKKLLVGRAKLVRPRVSDVVRRDCIAWAAKGGHYVLLARSILRAPFRPPSSRDYTVGAPPRRPTVPSAPSRPRAAAKTE